MSGDVMARTAVGKVVLREPTIRSSPRMRGGSAGRRINGVELAPTMMMLTRP